MDQPGNKKEQFTLIFNQYSDALFRHCFFRLSDRDLAKDVVQETFMKVWGVFKKDEKVENMKAYLFRVANNLIIDQYRKKPTQSLDEAIENETLDQSEISIESDLTLLEDRFDYERAVKALYKLPESYREVLTMRFIDDLSIGEIAEFLGETENFVSVKIHRGIQKLKQDLSFL